MPSKYLTRTLHPQAEYHVWNRGSYKQVIFPGNQDYWIFRRIVRAALREFSGRVNIKSFALMPNHYHFRIYQAEKRDIVSFMHKIGTQYGMYLRQRYDHVGRFCEGPYKSKYLPTLADQLRTHVYILKNAILAGLGSDWPHTGTTV